MATMLGNGVRLFGDGARSGPRPWTVDHPALVNERVQPPLLAGVSAA